MLFTVCNYVQFRQLKHRAIQQEQRHNRRYVRKQDDLISVLCHFLFTNFLIISLFFCIFVYLFTYLLVVKF